MNRKQLIVAWLIGVLICISVFMTKDIIVVKYNKTLVDKQRIEHREKVENSKGISFADLVYPYERNEVATNILGLKFSGNYYSYKYQTILYFLIIGGLLIYTLRVKR